MIEATLKQLDGSGMVAMWAILATMLPEKEAEIKARLLAAEDSPGHLPGYLHSAFYGGRCRTKGVWGKLQKCNCFTGKSDSII